VNKIKVLNLYAGIGGNRKLWENVDVTAIEINPQIAKIYQDFFPVDKVIITDAHQYLLEHFEEYDFIWSSPPCPSHSRIRNVAGVGGGKVKPIYADMKLYEEIIFLKQVYYTSGTDFKGKYVVENVKSYYEPLIIPQEIQRHYFWSNFHISKMKFKTDSINKGNIEIWEKELNFDLKEYFDIDKALVLKNCVKPELGYHIFNCAYPNSQKPLKDYYKQETLIE